MWAVRTDGSKWYKLSPTAIPVTGATSYIYNWTVNIPAGTTYRLDVAYYNAAGSLVSHNYSPAQILVLP